MTPIVTHRKDVAVVSVLNRAPETGEIGPGRLRLCAVLPAPVPLRGPFDNVFDQLDWIAATCGAWISWSARPSCGGLAPRQSVPVAVRGPRGQDRGGNYSGRGCGQNLEAIVTRRRDGLYDPHARWIKIRKGYVGSASGAQNLLGRWQHYAGTGDGGNLNLLEVVAPDMDRDEVNQREQNCKNRLPHVHADARAGPSPTGLLKPTPDTSGSRGCGRGPIRPVLVRQK